MIAHESSANITYCTFTNNSAAPVAQLTPSTYSGSGGALFVQSASLVLENSDFIENMALSGQFDSGAQGGAVLLEDVQDASINNCLFRLNFASGYTAYSSYSSSGTGGAVGLKFSTTQILGCKFLNNWVSVGGSQMSAGGALAG
jgi:hypothetical protein